MKNWASVARGLLGEELSLLGYGISEYSVLKDWAGLLGGMGEVERKRCYDWRGRPESFLLGKGLTCFSLSLVIVSAGFALHYTLPASGPVAV